MYEKRPANAAEAAARRAERFQRVDAPSGPMAAPEAETNAVFPMTLDLRMPAPGEKRPASAGAGR